VAALVVALLVGGGSATAAKLIDSGDIRNGSIRNRDVRKGSISLSRLSPGVQQLLRQVAQNRANANSQQQASSTTAGPQGAKGDKGDKGDPGTAGGNGGNGANGLDSDQPRVVQAGALRGFTLPPGGDNGATTDNGTVSFEAPPAPSTLGNRAMRFQSANGKPVAVYLPFPSGYSPAGPRPLLGELTKVSYGSMIHTQPQPALDVSFQIEVVKADVPGSSTGYTTMVYEPYQNGSPDTVDEWHRHSVDLGRVWSSRALASGDCSQDAPCPFRVFREQNPNAEILTMKFRIGQNSGDGWTGFDGYVDDLSFGIGPVTRFDFGN
jgi:hypothetical protein